MIPLLLLIWAGTLRVHWGSSLEGAALRIVFVMDLALLLQESVLSKWAKSLHAHAVADGAVSTPALDEARVDTRSGSKLVRLPADENSRPAESWAVQR